MDLERRVMWVEGYQSKNGSAFNLPSPLRRFWFYADSRESIRTGCLRINVIE